VPSPFDSHQLKVHITPHISTRWQHRMASLSPMAEVMANQFHAEPGNYLAFFSSHDYLQQTLDRLQQRHTDIPVWHQARNMSEPERDAFVARFTETGQGIGFAVLGGAFGEGIDLPGRRLIGAFVATLGLPQVNPVNELLRARLQQRFGRGYDYAYLFPGVQRVVQAGGRVIRSETDHGTVWLMDDRFGRAEVRRLLPVWWSLAPVASGQRMRAL
jgi:DNA excision repair protein ERCC-2